MSPRDPFRALPPGVQRIPFKGLIVIMDDRLIVDRPFFTAGEYFDQPLVNIFLDAPSEERTVFPRKGLVSGSRI